MVDRISRVTGPYDVNSFAVTAAFAALADQAYTDRGAEVVARGTVGGNELDDLPSRGIVGGTGRRPF